MGERVNPSLAVGDRCLAVPPVPPAPFPGGPFALRGDGDPRVDAPELRGDRSDIEGENSESCRSDFPLGCCPIECDGVDIRVV